MPGVLYQIGRLLPECGHDQEHISKGIQPVEIARKPRVEKPLTCLFHAFTLPLRVYNYTRGKSRRFSYRCRITAQAVCERRANSPVRAYTRPAIPISRESARGAGADPHTAG
jgi:hypothetical protein